MPPILRPMLRRAAPTFIAFASLAAASAATAQDNRGATADITGTWEFWTERYDVNPLTGAYCTMSGDLTLRATGDPDVFEGELTAYESCGGEQIYEAHQSAIAARAGDTLTIESTLERVLPRPDTYQPDNFDLTIVHGSLMQGELRSADIAPVTFERGGALVS